MNRETVVRQALHDEIVTKYGEVSAQRDALLAALRLCLPYMEANAQASHLTDGFRPRRNWEDGVLERVKRAIKEGEGK